MGQVTKQNSGNLEIKVKISPKKLQAKVENLKYSALY